MSVLLMSKLDWTCRVAGHAEAATFVRAHHYSGGAANTSVLSMGLFRNGDPEMMGAAMWMPPTKVCAQTIRGEDWRSVLCLSRLAVHPDVPGNGASFMLGACIRALRAGGRWLSLVTYADQRMGHTGAIYRATNWQYVGETRAEPYWLDSEGRQVARKATKSRTAAQMVALGFVRAGASKKHKFAFHLQPRPE